MKIESGLTHLSRRKSGLTVFYLFVLGIITYYILPVPVFLPGTSMQKFSLGIIFAAAMAALFYLLLRPVFLWKREVPVPERPVGKVFAASFLAFFSVCLVYLTAYYPGGMTSDSFIQWEQMQEFRFNDWHPAFSTLLNWFFTRIDNSPASIALADSLFFSLVFASMTAYLEELGLSRRVLFVICALFVLNPVNGIMAITIWKDIPYSVSLLWLTLLAMKITYSRGRWLDSRYNMAVLSGSLAFTALLRHNGMAPALLMMATLFILCGRQRRNALAVVLSALCLLALVKGPLYWFLEVEPGCRYQRMVNPIMQVGGIIAAGGALTEEEIRVVENILPLEKWKEGYSVYSEVPLTSMSGFNMEYFTTNGRDFLRAWAGMALRNPRLALRAYLYRTAIIWRIMSPPGNRVYTNYAQVEPNSLGLATESRMPLLKAWLDDLLWLTNDSGYLWIFWKPATYMLLILLFGVVALVKNGRRWLLVLTPVIGNTLGLMLITTSDQSRYYYATMIIAPFIIGAAFLKDGRIGRGIKEEGEPDLKTSLRQSHRAITALSMKGASRN